MMELPQIFGFSFVIFCISFRITWLSFLFCSGIVSKKSSTLNVVGLVLTSANFPMRLFFRLVDPKLQNLVKLCYQNFQKIRTWILLKRFYYKHIGAIGT